MIWFLVCSVLGKRALTLRLKASFPTVCTRKKELIGLMGQWIFLLPRVRSPISEYLGGDVIPSPSYMSCRFRFDRTLLPRSWRAFWESISSFLQIRGGWWRQFERPGVVGSEKGEGIQGWNILSNTCLVLASWSFLHRCRDLRRGMTSDRGSLVDMSPKFGGEARLVGWGDQSVRIWIYCIFLKYVYTEM